MNSHTGKFGAQQNFWNHMFTMKQGDFEIHRSKLSLGWNQKCCRKFSVFKSLSLYVLLGLLSLMWWKIPKATKWGLMEKWTLADIKGFHLISKYPFWLLFLLPICFYTLRGSFSPKKQIPNSPFHRLDS